MTCGGMPAASDAAEDETKKGSGGFHLVFLDATQDRQSFVAIVDDSHIAQLELAMILYGLLARPAQFRGRYTLHFSLTCSGSFQSPPSEPSCSSCSALGVSALGGSQKPRMPFAELPYPVCQEILWIGFGYLGDRSPMHYPRGSLG